MNLVIKFWSSEQYLHNGSRKKNRRKEGKRYRKTFLKLCLDVLAAVVVGSIIYAMIAEFSDSDYLAQAKGEIDLGAGKVDAYHSSMEKH